MNKIRTSKFVEFSPSTLVLLTIVLVAHIAFSGLSAVDMAMQRKLNDKYYLYVEHSEGQGISVPTHPKEVGVARWPDPGLSGRMSLTGDLGIIAESEVFPMHSITSPTTLYFGIYRIPPLLE